MKTSKILATASAGAFVSAGGFAAAAAIAASSAPPPTKTVTVNVGQGATGPAGPAGPKGDKGDTGATGPAGSFSCLDGYNPGILVLNAPGGQTKIYTCIEGP